MDQYQSTLLSEKRFIAQKFKSFFKIEGGNKHLQQKSTKEGKSLLKYIYPFYFGLVEQQLIHNSGASIIKTFSQ